LVDDDFGARDGDRFSQRIGIEHINDGRRNAQLA